MAVPVQIADAIAQMMLRDAREDLARECCGLLAGHDEVITHIFPATNAASKPETRYEIAPKEIFQCMRDMRAAGLKLLGIYHSHPNGKNEPSPSDMECACYPETPYFIVSPLAETARPIRAFFIRDSQFTELEIQIVASDRSGRPLA